MTDASAQPPGGHRRRARQSRRDAGGVTPSQPHPSQPDPAQPLQAHLRAARADFENQVARTRADFEEANERIKQRTGRDLLLAILIGLGFGIALLLSLIIWKPLFLVVALAAALLAVFELARALQTGGRRIDLAPQIAGAVAMLLSGWYLQLWLHWVLVCAVVVVIVVWRLIAQMAAHDGRRYRDVWDDVLAGGLVQLYVPFSTSLAVILLRQEHGEWWVLAFIIIAVVADTGAYVAGLLLGKHPMAPRISPKKTWEGFGGAVIAALVAGVLLAAFMLAVPWWTGLILGAVILGTATLGDLGESMIKRDLGIKDMSSWLPGHGGLLDRLDSILPSAGAALALYFLLTPLAAQ